jgi:sigma-B regulation protein RsbU (phosphoserine phosphatase)
MPDGPPEIPGLSIAASCTPAREVSGDFFDFLPMANGGLAVVTGEGGNDGLASALTIALTKGYLLYRTQQPGGSAQSPRAILTRLDQVLGTMLRRESGQTSLALVCVDPVRRTCAMARVGRWPQVLLLRGDNTVEEVSPREGEQPLGADDAIVIVTDGIAKLLERSSGESPTEVLRRAGAAAKSESAARLHDEFLAAARASTRGAEVGDDITTVVLCLKRAESGHLESAA